ncbi:MAG: integrase core domain-containing protein [Bacteroidales bacterium]|jgi:transposase-like protein|nr:integrase core domain-containing protein [Bacteroidales bacterium]
MATASYFDHELKSQFNRSFSEDFKRKKIREPERNHTSITDICRTYSVSRTYNYRWIYKYSAMAQKQVKQVIEPKSDTAKIKALHERVKELERIIGQKQLQIEFKTIIRELKMINSMTEEKVYENSHAERLNGTIKNNYLYHYGPNDLKSLRKLLDKAVFMYNTGKPHKALNELTPTAFRKTVDNEDNYSSNLPSSTVNIIHQKRRNYSIKKVNAIQALNPSTLNPQP